MPTEKSQAIESTLTHMTGISRHDAAEQGLCTWCKNPVTGFRDDLSIKEWMISGFCQICQDDTFGTEE